MADDYIPSREKEGGTMWTRQTFNRIRSIEAVKGMVRVNVKEDNDPNYIGGKVESKAWTVREAAQHAQALNSIAHQLPAKDKAVAMDIVEAVIAACKEAQKQSTDPKWNKKFRVDLPDNYKKSTAAEDIRPVIVDSDGKPVIIDLKAEPKADLDSDQTRPEALGDAGDTAPLP